MGDADRLPVGTGRQSGKVGSWRQKQLVHCRAAGRKRMTPDRRTVSQLGRRFVLDQGLPNSSWLIIVKATGGKSWIVVPVQLGTIPREGLLSDEQLDNGYNGTRARASAPGPLAYVQMEITMNKLQSLLAGSLAALALIGAAAAAAGEVVTEAQIEAATTGAQHEAIARSYDEEAAASDRRAESHGKLAKTYRHTHKSSSGASMASHCRRLEKAYRSAAGEYRSLAAEHREMAAATK